MFGIKKNTLDQKIDEPLAAKVQVIPADFYGGVNPVVTFKNVAKQVELGGNSSVSSAEKKVLDKQTAAGSGNDLHPASFLARPRFLVIGGLVILLVASAGVSLYYWLQSKKNVIPPPVPVVFVENPPVVEVPTTTPVATVPTTTPVVLPTPVSLADQPLVFPSILLGDSADTDKDGLTDREEELLTTDFSIPDTDEDSYTDSHEIFYLYNPSGREPMKLLDSGLVKEYRNPVFGYTLLYPTTWAIGDVDGTYRDVLFSTITGENIEVRVFDKEPTMDFAAWFDLHAKDQKYGDLVTFEGYFNQLSGYRRADWLVYYFPTNTRVYTLIFHTTDSNIVNFRSIIKIMARSFAPQENMSGAQASTPIFTGETTSTLVSDPLVTGAVTTTDETP